MNLTPIHLEEINKVRGYEVRNMRCSYIAVENKCNGHVNLWTDDENSEAKKRRNRKRFTKEII